MELGAELIVADFSKIEKEFDSIYGQSFGYKGEHYALPLLGEHQLKNAAVALETVEQLRKTGLEAGAERCGTRYLCRELARPL